MAINYIDAYLIPDLFIVFIYSQFNLRYVNFVQVHDFIDEGNKYDSANIIVGKKTSTEWFTFLANS